MKFKERLDEIKRVYGVDIEILRTDDSKADDKKLNRKRKYKDSFYIPVDNFKEIYNNGIVLNPTIYRVINQKFDVESNGRVGYILTFKK